MDFIYKIKTFLKLMHTPWYKTEFYVNMLHLNLLIKTFSVKNALINKKMNKNPNKTQSNCFFYNTEFKSKSDKQCDLLNIM